MIKMLLELTMALLCLVALWAICCLLFVAENIMLGVY